MNDVTPESGSRVVVNPAVARMHLEKLLARLPDGTVLYACLRDLLENGPVAKSAAPDLYRPSRSDILHYVAKWAHSIGLSQEACLEWLTPYAVDVLVAISTSSLGAIRHNVKGVVKYIYAVAYPFNCGKERNPVQCRCDPQCPIYHRPEAPLPKPVPPAPTDPRSLRHPGVVGRIKDHYREAFEKSLLVIREMRAAGQKPGKIIERLNAENLPTPTGRKWTHSLLARVRIKEEGAVQGEDGP